MGTAFAVVAIYILTLLLPLHQAAGLQRDLAALGYQTLGNVSICNPSKPASSDEKSDLIVKCPSAGIAKNPFADAPSGKPLDFPLLAASGMAPASATVLSPRKRDLRDGWSRAPPGLA